MNKLAMALAVTGAFALTVRRPGNCIARNV